MDCGHLGMFSQTDTEGGDQVLLGVGSEIVPIGR
jgi:hypothetical protein